MENSPVIETQRLRLRGLREADIGEFAAMNADPRVMEFFPSVLTRAESEEAVGRLKAHLANHGHAFWVAESAGAGRFLGVVGLLTGRFEAHFSPFVEIIWRFAHASWGSGYATEAALGALDYGFSRLDLPEIVAFTASNNVRSRRLMERLDMTYDPADDFDHPDIPGEHPLCRHALYRLPRSRWRGMPSG